MDQGALPDARRTDYNQSAGQAILLIFTTLRALLRAHFSVLMLQLRVDRGRLQQQWQMRCEGKWPWICEATTWTIAGFGRA